MDHWTSALHIKLLTIRPSKSESERSSTRHQSQKRGFKMDAQLYPRLEAVAGPSCFSIPLHLDGQFTPEKPLWEAF